MNWRKHPEAQVNAVRGMLQRIGWADACIVRELPDGGYQLIDGHLPHEAIEWPIDSVRRYRIAETYPRRLAAPVPARRRRA